MWLKFGFGNAENIVLKISTVETVICDPSRDLHEKVAYDRGSLNTVSLYNDREVKQCMILNIFKIE